MLQFHTWINDLGKSYHSLLYPSWYDDQQWIAVNFLVILGNLVPRESIHDCVAVLTVTELTKLLNHSYETSVKKYNKIRKSKDIYFYQGPPKLILVTLYIWFRTITLYPCATLFRVSKWQWVKHPQLEIIMKCRILEVVENQGIPCIVLG